MAEEKQWNVGIGTQIACVGYLLLPLLIFLCGWLRWYYTVPMLLVIAFCFVRMLPCLPRLYLPPLDRQSWIKIICALCIICVVTVFSGVGGRVFQTVDHFVRNGIFRILVEESWPVVIGDAALVYYIGFWMPAALVGKAFGLLAGFYFQMLWMALGLMLLFLLLCLWRKRIVLWPLIVFLLFSGLDVLASAYMQAVFPELEMFRILKSSYSIDHWSIQMMYPSLMTNLFWGYNQAAPIYVLILLLLLQPDCRNYAFFSAPALLSGTIPVMGLVPIALTLACSKPVADDPIDRRWIRGADAWKKTVGCAFSLQNILGGVSIALILWLYLSINRSGAQSGLQYGFVNNSKLGVLIYAWMMYAVAVITEFGIYLLLIAREQKRNALLPVLVLLLATSPFLRIGSSADFNMRIAMVTLPFFALIVMDTLVRYKSAGKKLAFGLLVGALALGAVTPMYEIARTSYHTFWLKDGSMSFASKERIINSANFGTDVNNGSIFFEKLAKERD